VAATAAAASERTIQQTHHPRRAHAGAYHVEDLRALGLVGEIEEELERHAAQDGRAQVVRPVGRPDHNHPRLAVRHDAVPQPESKKKKKKEKKKNENERKEKERRGGWWCRSGPEPRQDDDIGTEGVRTS
jgi:hypothetical protein